MQTAITGGSNRATSTALVSDSRCETGLFMCLEKDDRISMSMEGGDPMGHCDDVHMDARNRRVTV